MKRYEWEFPVAPERLQLQVREITREVRPDRQFALRGALLERFSSTESSLDDCPADTGSLGTIRPRAN